ncbi:hypothetical protein GGH92_008715, partial [Coemansia sp. RSA 2673]
TAGLIRLKWTLVPCRRPLVPGELPLTGEAGTQLHSQCCEPIVFPHKQSARMRVAKSARRLAR